MPPRPVVYVTREIPRKGLDMLAETCDVNVWDEKNPPSRAHVRERVAELEAEALLCNVSDDVDETVMAAAPLRVISTMSVGYDHVDLAAAAKRNIAVGHTPGVLSETTADLAWALVLTCARRVVEANDYVLDDEWECWGPTILTGQDVHGATLGIVGLGSIGTAVARRGAGFDVDVLYAGPRRKREQERELADVGVDATHVPLEHLLEESDIVTLHVPLSQETHQLIGREHLRRMRDDAILVNTSRGKIVDTDALDEALAKQWIHAAGLDVTDPEPLPVDHPLLRHEPGRLVVTPHIGSASVPTRRKMSRMAAENVLAGLDGQRLPNSALHDAGLA